MPGFSGASECPLTMQAPPWRLQARTWVEARSKKEGRGLEKDGGHGLGV